MKFTFTNGGFMKIIALVLAVASFAVSAQVVHVRPYTDSKGNYHEGYNRTAPNHTINDNWSTKGNVNPYTGQPGTVQPQPSSAWPQPSNQLPMQQDCGYRNGQYVCK